MEFDDESMRKAGYEMRQAFFSVFGHPDEMSPARASAAADALMVIHAGELIEAVARFKKADIPLLDACMLVIEAIIKTNPDIIAELLGKDDAHEFVRGLRLPN